MNPQLTATIRYVLSIAVSYGVGKGWFTADQASTVLTDLMAAVATAVPLAMAVWGIWSQSKSSLASAVQKSSTEQVVTTDPAVAAAAPGAVLASTAQATVVAPVPKPS